MNEEEIKAIENLKTEYEKLIKEDNILFPLYKSDAKRLINLIDKQNKELNKLKSKNEELLRKLRNRVKENEKLIKYSNYKKEFSTLNKQIDKQNKVIDEMAKYIEEIGEVDNICNKKDCYADEYINGHCQKCLKCIKQYFIRKVEENDKD